MHSFDNKKELENGFLKIEEQRNFSGKVTDVTLWYYPDGKKTGLMDWGSQIEFEIQSRYDNQDIEKVRIWKFLSKTVDQGYGTVVLQEFFHYIEKQTQPVEIVGWLSAVDEEDENNHQRRDHIYRKFGFEIVDGWVKTTIN